MKNVFQIISCLLFISIPLCLKSQHADCNNLLELKDTIYHTQQITGFGAKQEFEGNDLTNNKALKNEANSIWYLIKAPTTGRFIFDIISNDDHNDWDFLLYKNANSFCKKLNDKVVQPIRSNLSRSATTGLSLTAQEEFVGAGIQNNYSKAVTVTQGDELVLLVNNAQKGGGKHTLQLHFAKKPVEKQKVVEVVEQKKPRITTFFELKVQDIRSKKPVNGNLTIYGLDTPLLQLEDVAKHEAHLIRKNRKVTVETYAKGYMLTAKDYKISKTKSKFLAAIELEKIEVGAWVNLNQIQFYGNEYRLLPAAKPSLKTLVQFMKKNPSVAIEVGGHVNAPGLRNIKKLKDLSSKRANAVKEHLVAHGIESQRIDYAGYGNSEMIYPNPKNPDQEAANRRVEVVIVAQ